jgi:hypothetical protein
LHPRALLTPFTDNVDLTAADRRMYRGQAEAQQAKGFQRVDVSFDESAEPDGVSAPRDPGIDGADQQEGRSG